MTDATDNGWKSAWKQIEHHIALAAKAIADIEAHMQYLIARTSEPPENSGDQDTPQLPEIVPVSGR